MKPAAPSFTGQGKQGEARLTVPDRKPMAKTVLDMNLKKLLTEKKASIVKRWFAVVVESYPEDSSGFLKKTDAQFTNPVGYTLAEGIEGLYDALLQGVIPDTLSVFLDSIVRIRAVQDFTPSQAVGFIFPLKGIIRDELGPAIAEHGLSEELTAFESVVDDLALYSFDRYMHCREKLAEIKVNEMKNNTFRLLQQVNERSGKKKE